MNVGLKTWDKNGKPLLDTTTQSMKILGHIVISSNNLSGEIKFTKPKNTKVIYFCMPQVSSGFVGYLELTVTELDSGLRYQAVVKKDIYGKPLFKGDTVPIKLFYGYV